MLQAYEYLSPINFHIAAIYRDRVPIELSDDTEIEVSDTIMIASEVEDVNKDPKKFKFGR